MRSDAMTTIQELGAAIASLSNVVKVSWVMVAMWAAMQVWLWQRLRVEVPVAAPALAPASSRAPRRARSPRKKLDVPPEVTAAISMPSLESPHAIAVPVDSVYR
jgi:hypothetical protein